MEITEIVRGFKELALIRSKLFYRSTEFNHQFALSWFVDDMMQIFDTITISPEDLVYIKTKLLESLNEVQEQNQSWLEDSQKRSSVFEKLLSTQKEIDYNE